MRIIHFSDFHLRADHLERAKSIFEFFLTALSDVHEERKIDLIIFTGDMIDKAGEKFDIPKITTALASFEKLVIKPLTEKIGIPANRFIFTMGNHEVDRKRTDEDSDNKLTKELKSHADVDRYIHDKEKSEARIEEYNNYRDKYWDKNKGDADIETTPYQYGVKIIIDGIKVGINCLNTAWRCFDSKTDEHKIVLGKSQITDFRSFFEDCNLRLAIGHHHPNMMNQFETNTLNGLIAQNYDAFFCGHTHDNDGVYINRPQGSCFCFTAPGTLSINESEEKKYRNGFMVIDYEQECRYVEAQCYYQNDNADFVKDYNYGKKGVWRQIISGSSIIKPINLSLLCQRKEGEFITNEYIEDIISNLRDNKINTIHFVALTGLGKTRILHEAFNDEKPHPNHYYCEYSDNAQGLLYDIENIITEHKEQNGLIILDNCPNTILEKAVEKRNRYSSKFRIIGVNNDFYDRRIDIKDCIQISLEQENTRQTVDEFIERNIPEINGNRNPQEQIKKIADGFPGMAVELVSEYQKEHNINVHTVDHIVKKMLKFEKGMEKEQEIALRSMALFQPCPYRDEYKDAFRFIREEEEITPLFGKSEEEKRRLFVQTINRYNGALIETTQSWLNIRPFPLAIWLVEKWFEDGVDEESMEKIVKRIEALDKPSYTVIRDGLYKRLNYMQDSISAQEMIARLTTGPNAPFCNEKVVCSDLGSRLFLAMSSVNPSAIASCIEKVLLHRSIDWVRDNVVNDIRRNLVWALEKLCFRKESYQAGIKVMALLAVAENETWGNNATNQIKQLFHAILPGTQATLYDRIETLLYLKSLGKTYKVLTLECFNHAFNNDNFSRDGSSSQFGIKQEKDYMPKSNKEILDYWELCRNILIHWVDEDISIVDHVAQIVTNHGIRWIFDGMISRMFPLIKKIAICKDWNWEDMYTLLSRVNKRKFQIYSNKFQQELEEFKQKLRPSMFCQKLKDVRMSIYNNNELDTTKRLKYEQALFRPLANEFLEERIYMSEQELKGIVTDKDYHDIWFTLALQEIITDKQLEDLLTTLRNVIENCGGEDFTSSFISRICYIFRESLTLRTFLQQIYDAGYRKLYVRLLANSETEGLLSYDEIKRKIKQKQLSIEAAEEYLAHASTISWTQIGNIIKRYYADYPNKIETLMDFICLYRYDKEILTDQETCDTIKQVALAYPIADDNSRSNYKYAQYVKYILEDYHDDDFAIAINKKLIKELSKGYFYKDFDGIYVELIRNYRTVIWDDFVTAFVSDDSYGFIRQINEDVGSGSSFGAGILFQVEDDCIKEMCKAYPEKAPYRIAQMIPVFKDDSNFSDWFIWILNNYGEKKEVLDSLRANLGTFSWSGSLVPLLEKKKRCFVGISNHQRIEVRRWVESCLHELEEELRQELNREEYMRLHYD
ncbi:MAG: metallophosphoesterase [Bacteroidaceae bacterium]|nr:metallophosphoesterase [Bacteroidaceae bacterium]